MMKTSTSCFFYSPFLLILLLNFVQNAQAEDPLNTKTIKTAQAAMTSGHKEKAFTLYYQAATEENNPLAQFTLGFFNQNGWTKKADAQIACQWFEQAAKGGIPMAQHESGICYEKGIQLKANPAIAANWYQKAAEGGHHLSLCYLGNLYMTGLGVAKHPTKALELCYSSAQQGSPLAQVWMGKFYLEGDESIRDYKKAYQWFEMASQKKVPEAFYYLGLMIEKHTFVGNTPAQARYRFEQAAELKYTPAYFSTGKLYFYAKPDEKTKQLSAENLAKAYMWLSITKQRSKDSVEQTETKEMLAEILAVMPTTWRPDLDQKIALHIAKTIESGAKSK